MPNNSRYISHSIINVPAIARSAICINDTCTTDTCTHIRGVIEVSMTTALIKIVYLLTIRWLMTGQFVQTANITPRNLHVWLWYTDTDSSLMLRVRWEDRHCSCAYILCYNLHPVSLDWHKEVRKCWTHNIIKTIANAGFSGYLKIKQTTDQTKP